MLYLYNINKQAVALLFLSLDFEPMEEGIRIVTTTCRDRKRDQVHLCHINHLYRKRKPFVPSDGLIKRDRNKKVHQLTKSSLYRFLPYHH
ncbi:hypothetical protein CEXT_748931 [Caerostris extrusa]|uniref:Uncharacterized protein n=1 Tax=Caerostris extrusa TaxID=172846 RepID=A0AAV4QTL7_CAEEX|nr:hypothetical protein CEXT_748931 [Caerostris extrusa]